MDSATAIKWQKQCITLLVWINCILLVPTLLIAPFALFAFDAPGSTSNPAIVIAFLCIISSPALVIAAIILSKKFAHMGKFMSGVIIGAIPLIAWAVIAIFMALSQWQLHTHDDSSGDTYGEQGSIAMNKGKYADAEKAYWHAIALYKEKESPDFQYLCYVFDDLALCLQKEKKFSEAEKVYKTVLISHINEKILSKAGDLYDVDVITLLQTLLSYAVMLNETHHQAEANTMMSRARRLLQSVDLEDEISRMESVISMDRENGAREEANRTSKCLALLKTLRKNRHNHSPSVAR